MPNKTRYIISADRDYVVKLEDGTEIEISGTNLIEICKGIVKIKQFKDKLIDLDETGKAWF